VGPTYALKGNAFLDLDECTLHEDSCHKNADCINMIGSYKCECVTGFSGNGFNCTGKQADGMWTTIRFVIVDLPDLRTKREVYSFCILCFVKFYP
jgi:hypothetical protein